MKKIKVGFLIAEKFPEPLGSFLLDQITGVIDKGFDVKIFSVNENPQTENNREIIEKYDILEKTHFINLPKNKFVRFMRAIPLFLKYPVKSFKSLNVRKYGKISWTLLPLFVYDATKKVRKDFDIIHGHFGQLGLVGSVLKDLGVKGQLITSFHGGDVNSYPLKTNKDVYLPLFEKGDFFTVNSEFTKSKIVELGCKDFDKMKTLPMIIDSSKFDPSKTKSKKSDKVIVLTVGRLVEEKGHEFVIRGLAESVKKLGKERIEYRIVGDGPLEEPLKKLAKELGIEEGVVFVGRTIGEDLLKEYSGADIFALTSIPASYGSGEGQGVALEEAQAMNLPVITSNFAGLPEGMIDGETGFTVPLKDVKEISKKIDFFVKNPKLRMEMGKKGRDFIKKKFGRVPLTNKLSKIYRSIAN
jgi:colanic acid/amylovoran biosynthesis glycosyltransferase